MLEVALIVTTLFLVAAILIAQPKNRRVKIACGRCKRPMVPSWTECMHCGWRPSPRLSFVTGPLAGNKVGLEAVVTSIGSIAGNSIVLADPGVSRRHLEIRQSGMLFAVHDTDSSNGVYINECQVVDDGLFHGDRLRIGNSDAIFEIM